MLGDELSAPEATDILDILAKFLKFLIPVGLMAFFSKAEFFCRVLDNVSFESRNLDSEKILLRL